MEENSVTENTVACLVKKGEETDIEEKTKSNDVKLNPQKVETTRCFTSNKVFRSKMSVQELKHSSHIKIRCIYCDLIFVSIKSL